MTDTSKTATSTQIQGNGDAVPCGIEVRSASCLLRLYESGLIEIDSKGELTVSLPAGSQGAMLPGTCKGGAGPNALRK